MVLNAVRADQLPQIFQGGMGMGISHWHLARRVAEAGQLGVISGTAIDTILIRRLQLGDEGGHMRAALAAFPKQSIADAILQKYYIPEGKEHEDRFRSASLPGLHMPKERQQLIVAANFCEVWLAKQGHNNPIGINLLDKIAAPNLASLFGALLAGIDVVCMGAGNPSWVPKVLRQLVEWQSCEKSIPVNTDSAAEQATQCFDPAELGIKPYALHLPLFIPIISSEIMGKMLIRRTDGAVDGFIVENHRAGGHNAPPRNKHDYQDSDDARLDRIAALGLPFWLAGNYANHEQFTAALEQGAHGVQIGSAFAFCQDSGMEPKLRDQCIDSLLAGEESLNTDFNASPTGYPFKVLNPDPGLIRNNPENTRQCDLGYLRQAYKKDDDSIGYRCPAEAHETFISKGGHDDDCTGKICLCNGLLATCGLAQKRDGVAELPLVTAGTSVKDVKRLAVIHKHYRAADVICDVLGKQTESLIA